MKNKNEKSKQPIEERNVKVRVIRLSNGWYEFPKGHGPDTPIPPQLFRDMETTGEVHWKTHEVDERPYRKARFNMHLNDRLAQIVAAQKSNTELKD